MWRWGWGGRRKGRYFYMDDLIGHSPSKWVPVLLILSVFFLGAGFSGDRDMSSMSSVPHGDKAASPWCYLLVPVSVSSRFFPVPLWLWRLLNSHKMLKINSKWNSPAAWRKKSFLLSLYSLPIGSALTRSEKLDRIQMPCPEPADGLGEERHFIG